jgi:uncharacterized membrane protein
MSQAHIHLIVTHLPIFGSLLGTLVLIFGLFTNSTQTKIASFLLFIISAIGAGIAYLTGEGAEEAVENIQGISENIIEQHEDFAMFALVSLIILGVSSLLAIIVANKNNILSKSTTMATLVIAIVSFALVARTGYLGGQIRHTEISSSTGITQTNANENGGNDDDD